MFDVSTKLEETDRYVTWEEARRIAGLTTLELVSLKYLLSKVNDVVTEMVCLQSWKMRTDIELPTSAKAYG
jgi:phosphoribosylaminoimidazole-succinocarboxamide synthase